MSDFTPLERVRAYYRDLNTGDMEKVARHFHPDANHFYTRLGPHRSAQAIGEITEQGVKHLDASWHLEHGIEQGDEVVIEWTMLWRDPRHGNEQRIDRGTEWFIVRDGLIAEVRAYHHSDAKNRAGQPARLRPRGPRPHDAGAVGRGARARRRRARTPRTGCAP